MRQGERIGLYAAVAVGLGLSASAYLGAGMGNRAVARAWQGESPADAGSTGGPAAAGAQRIASCDVYLVAELLMRSDANQAIMRSEQLRIGTQLEPLETELRDMEARLRTLMEQPTPDPAARAEMARFQTKREDYVNLRERLTRDFELTASRTNFAVYQQVIEAARTVARARGYTHVFATRVGPDTSSPQTPVQLTMGMLARPIVVGPEADDLTVAVMTELKIDPKSLVPAAGAPGAAAGGAPAAPAASPTATPEATPAGTPAGTP